MRAPHWLWAIGFPALTACGGDDAAAGGGGESAASSSSVSQSSTASSSSTGQGVVCTKPDTPMPSPRLQSAQDEDLDTTLGVVTRSEELEIEIDECFTPDAECVPTPVTLTMDDGLGFSVPVGALVRIELQPNPSQMGFGNGDPTPTAIVTNVPSADRYDNPVANDERIWFYSSPAFLPDAPGVDARLETVCEQDVVTQLIRVSDLVVSHDDGEARLVEGDATTVSLSGAEHEVSFLGAWMDENGFCRWQIARREP